MKNEKLEETKEVQKSKWNKIKPWIPLIIACLYGVSPIDFIPDVISGIGIADDALLLIIGTILGIKKSK